MRDITLSQKLFKRAEELIPGGVNSPVRAFRSVKGTPFFTQKAQGAILTCVDGREFIDFVCSWGPAIHGHNHPAIKEAIAMALEMGTSFGTPNVYELEMAALIVQLVPWIEKVRMCNSGTEATMSCIRLARGFTGRDKIIKFAGCYHGHVDSLLVKAGSGALTFGYPDSAGIPSHLAKDTLVLSFNDTRALEEVFDTYGEEIAGVILEPIPANIGLILPVKGFLKEVRRLCSKYGSLLIFDEVMTGFRLALGGAQEVTGVGPDLTALGKIIGGGLPIGAFGGKAEIMNKVAPLGPVYQAGTLSGNPLAMAAGIKSLKLLKETNPYQSLHDRGKSFTEALKELAAKKGVALQVPQMGSMFSFFFCEEPVMNDKQALQSQSKYFSKLFHHALNHGVYLPPSAYEACFISTAHTEEILEQALNVLKKAIQSF
jgi:glutamate-1-semialdehyde 2,1-aminomutase